MVKDLINFTNSLNHTFKKNEIKEILDTNMNTINNEIIPLLEFTKERLIENNINFLDIKPLVRLNDDAELKAKDTRDLFDKLIYTFSKFGKQYSNIMKMVDKDLPDVITRENLTVREASLLNFISQLTFITVFTPDFMLLVVDKELEDKDLDIDKEFLVNKKLTDVNSKIYTYANLIGFYYHSLDLTIKNITKVPDVKLELDINKSGILTSILRKFKIDKFLPGTNGFIGNPIYHIRLWLVDREMDKYESLKDKKRLVELKLMALKQQESEGKVDPKIKKQIEYYEEKLKKIEYKIQQIEED